MPKQFSGTKFLDFTIALCITLIFFLCPLFFTGITAQNIGFEKFLLFYFLVLLGTVSWVTKGVIMGELNFKRTPLDWPIVATLVIFIVSTVLSVSQKDSLIGAYGSAGKSLAAAITFALFYYLLVNNLNLKKIRLIFWSFLGSVSITVVYSLLQILKIYILPFSFTKYQYFNPIGSMTTLSMFLIVTLPLLIIAIAQTKEIQPKLNKYVAIAIKVFLSIIALVSLVILTLLNGFTFWPAAVVAVVVLLVFLLAKIMKVANVNLVVPIMAFLVSIILLVLGNFNLVNLNLPAEVGLSRKVSWEIAKNNVIKHPFFGSGPSTYYYSFAKYKANSFNSSPLWNIRFDSSTGEVFELIANVGALGALAVVILALIAVSICCIALIKNSGNEAQLILLALFSSFITAILFSSLFALNNALILVFVILSVLCLAVAVVNYPEKFKNLNLSFRASPKYALALAAIFLTVSAGVVILFTMGIKMYLADMYARRATMVSDLSQKVNYLNKSVQLAPYQSVYYLGLANAYVQVANTSILNNNASIAQEALSLAISSGKKAVDLNPNDANTLENLSLIYENATYFTADAIEYSENLYKKVMELDPESPAPYLRMALLDMAKANAVSGKTEQETFINDAIKHYDEALGKKADYAAAFYGKAIALEKLNKFDNSIDELRKAVTYDNSNLDYWFELGRLYFNRGASSQTSIAQTESDKIATGEGENQDLSVQTNQNTASLKDNNDLKAAEQIFLAIINQNNTHANALYSLAMVYQKTGQTDNLKIVVKRLMEILTDDTSKEAVKKQFPGMY